MPRHGQINAVASLPHPAPGCSGADRQKGVEHRNVVRLDGIEGRFSGFLKMILGFYDAEKRE